MKKHIETLLQRVSRAFPFLVVETDNYQATLADISGGLKEEKKGMALLHHDMARGAVGINDEGAMASGVMNSDKEPALTTAKLEECLQRALDLLPPKSILVIDDIHLLLQHRDETVRALYIQCIRNCRDAFKSSNRHLVFLCPKFAANAEIGNDFEVIVSPPPGDEDRIEIAKGIARSSKIEEPSKEDLSEVSDTLRGLSSFGVEQLCAAAVSKSGFNINILRSGSIAAVNATAGLSVIENKMTLDQLAGLEQGKKWGRMKAGGKLCPLAVVLIDEMGDQSAGQGDSNGINRDARSVMLGAMQNNGWRGGIFNGVAGTGKTQLGGAIADACKAMFINWDQGEMKGGIVSDSERMIRAAVGTLWNRFGNRVLFIGTTNSMEDIAPQMKRRFGTIFFFDVLTEAQQKPIWDFYMNKFGVTGELPVCNGWTGAEIERCSEIAWEFGIPLTEAAQFISPVVASMGDGLDKMRKEAEGKYLSVNYPGYFTTKKTLDIASIRKMAIKGSSGNN